MAPLLPPPSPMGQTPASCWDIKQATGTTANGAYTIAPAGTDVQVYCLMDPAMDGGGC